MQLYDSFTCLRWGRLPTVSDKCLANGVPRQTGGSPGCGLFLRGGDSISRNRGLGNLFADEAGFRLWDPIGLRAVGNLNGAIAASQLLFPDAPSELYKYG